MQPDVFISCGEYLRLFDNYEVRSSGLTKVENMDRVRSSQF